MQIFVVTGSFLIFFHVILIFIIFITFVLFKHTDYQLSTDSLVNHKVVKITMTTAQSIFTSRYSVVIYSIPGVVVADKTFHSSLMTVLSSIMQGGLAAARLTIINTGSSIKKLQGAIAEGAESERITVKGTKIISYASPEGGEELNDKLSQERSEAAQKAWKQIGKGAEAGSTEIKSVGQDWEGFQEAIKASNLEDKDLILRVLSMYSDPAVRESEIKNLSQVYTEIKEQVFPELRRSRFITELEYQNYSEADLKRLLEHKRLYLLDEEAILHLAALTDSIEVKQTLYRAVSDRMGSQKGLYNLGVTLLEKDSYSAAEVYFDKLKDQADADLLNARGVIALHGGKVAEATKLFEQSGTPEAKQNLGLVALQKGDFDTAASQLEGSEGRNEAIVKISKKDYDGAIKILEKEDSAEALYLAAVASARKGYKDGVSKYLKAAFEKDPSLRDTALKDIEFAGFEI